MTRVTPITQAYSLQDRKRRKKSKEEVKKMVKKPPDNIA